MQEADRSPQPRPAEDEFEYLERAVALITVMQGFHERIDGPEIHVVLGRLLDDTKVIPIVLSLAGIAARMNNDLNALRPGRQSWLREFGLATEHLRGMRTVE